MKVHREQKNGKMIIYLEGELDHHAAHEVLTTVGDILAQDNPMRCVLDLSGLSFMDSSGIAVILGINRRLKAYGGELAVMQVPRQPARVLTTAGVDRLVPMNMK